jgi:hypothetical protein
VNLLLGWILDNSDAIFKNARLTFAHDICTYSCRRTSYFSYLAEDMLAGFEFVLEQENVEEEKFQIADSISYLSALPEQESGTGTRMAA